MVYIKSSGCLFMDGIEYFYGLLLLISWPVCLKTR